MKIQWKQLIIAVLIPLAVGLLSGFISSGQMEAFEALKKPFLSPPGWLFPVVWTILYILMGIASYRIWIAPATDDKKKSALFVYGLQLVFNFFWSIIFFNLEMYLFAFIWLVALWILIYITYKRFGKIDTVAEYLLIPYLVWVAFAGYLNLSIWLLN
ncbi:MAG: tryptophan-rich sensory protein [Clostridia bacterium]|nr:tryptophan-rich sensory protein [Clostridia bacterium]